MTQKGEEMMKYFGKYATWRALCKGVCGIMIAGCMLTSLGARQIGIKEDAKKLDNAEKDIYQWFKTYSEVVGIVEKRAFRSVNFPKFIQDSLKAAVADVDAHSTFLGQSDYEKTMQATSGEFSGIGVSIMSKVPDDDALIIIDVIADGPAARVGIMSGDKIVEADGTKFKGLSTDEAVCKLKGKPGTEVVLKIVREKKPLEFKVARDIVKDQNALCYYFKKQGVYYLALRLFTENVAAQVKDLLKLANQGKCKGIIFDVRRNPGGILQSAIDMCGLFVKKNSLIAVTKDNKQHIIDRYFTLADPVLKAEVPMFVLIDNLTASAAEIFAGSLRYHSVQSYKNKQSKERLQIFLLGVPTFGKGSVQEVMPLSNGCALKLTTMLYYLPYGDAKTSGDDSVDAAASNIKKDFSLQAVGIEPDFLVRPKFFPKKKFKWFSEMYGKESALKNFITFAEASGELDEKKTKEENRAKKEEKENAPMTPEKMEQRFQEELAEDVQVQAAVNIINLLSVAKQTKGKTVATREKAVRFIKNHYLTDEKIEIEKVK